MANINIAFGSHTAITCTLNNLASGSAQQSNVIDNTSNLFLDAMVVVSVSVGTVVAPAAINVYVYGSEDGATYPNGVTGSDGAITLDNPTNLSIIGIVPVPTSTKGYTSNPISVAKAFGGVMPRKWGIVVLNNSGAALAASGNSASFSGVYATVV